MSETSDKSGAEEMPFYGGQAVLEGVMMRSRDEYATAVRRADGSVIVGRRRIDNYATRHRWVRWPLIRGNFALLDALVLGMESLQFSGNVALEDEAKQEAARQQEAGGEEEQASGGAGKQEPPTLSGTAFWLTMVPAVALGVGLFMLLPAYVVSLAAGSMRLESTVGKNLVEAAIRLLLIVGYIAGISLIGYIKRVFEYHGAEHKAINALEAGKEVTVENAMAFSTLHPRCGSAFILVVIAVKLILNCFLPWPESRLVLVLMRLAVLPPIVGISYEIIHFAGRHQGNLLARALAAPGMVLERLTTHQARPDQVEVAIYALAAVAPEVELPAGLAAPERVQVGKGGQIVRESSAQVAEAGQEAAEPADGSC